MTLGKIARAPRQDRKAFIESVQELPGVHDPHACRGELDRKGDPVQPLRERRQHVVVGIESGIDGSGSPAEEFDRRSLFEWSQRVLVLVAKAERLSAGHDHRDPRTSVEQRNEPAGRVDDLLEVVEDEDELAVAKVAH